MTYPKVNVGIVGCGNISSIYLEVGAKFDVLNIIALADLIPERAQSQAAKYHIPRVCSTKEMLESQDIEMILNITTPDAHFEVGQAALEAGKSVYNEKPLAITRQDGQTMLQTAKTKKLLVG